MPSKIFISYSSQDADFKEQLLKALHEPKRRGQFTLWHDQDIEIGREIAIEIKQAMETSQVAILLISNDYLNDCFEEYEQLLTYKHLLILPIFIKHCLIPDNFKKFKALNNAEQPIASFQGFERDKVLMDIAKKIVQVVQNIDNESSFLKIILTFYYI